MTTTDAQAAAPDASVPGCPACGSRAAAAPTWTRTFSSGEISWDYSFYRCASCKMGWLYPPPSDEVLTAIYSGGYRAYSIDPAEVAASPTQRAKMYIAWLAGRASLLTDGPLRSATHSLIHALELVAARPVSLTSSVPLALDTDAPILDYGCGSGWWLMSLKRMHFTELWGYDVPQPKLAILAGHGIKIVTEGDDAIPDRHFACIRLHHVLEHLRDPVATLARLKTKLRPGGSIVIEVPNFASWSAATLGAKWPGLRIPSHLGHFTPEALERLAGRAGLEVKSTFFVPAHSLARPALSKKNPLARQLHYRKFKDSPAADCMAFQLSPAT